jgi:SNF2 family DNA or RNA helicase
MREKELYDYQRFAVRHIVEHPAAGLFMEMGLGKTVITLTAINRLMFEELEVEKTLVIAPKRVVESVWATEAAEWEHLRHLRVSLVTGTERQRKEALQTRADIYAVSRDNVAWLVGHYQSSFPFDMVVIDELSSFKSAKAIRFRALRMVRPAVRRVVGLTGTPSPNGLTDLWPQLYLLDMGERLGKTITGYRQQYFVPGRSNGHVIYDYRLKASGEQAIYERISDICVSMKTEDYLQLPARIDRTVRVKLSEKERAGYVEFERTQVLALPEDDANVSAVNAAALSNKLQQYANGAVYDELRRVHEVHAAKLEALEELLEETQDRGVLLFYNFKHDLTRIEAKFRSFHPERIEGASSVRKWNDGKIKLLLAHPASAGHGLNLQHGGDVVVWFGPTWSLELWLQANARLLRQGRTRPVTVIKLVTEGTIDGDIVRALEGKREGQDALMEAVKARIRKVRG